MSLRFILGRAGTGKTNLCLEEIRTELTARPDGLPLIYLVPEQMTFQSEYLLSTTPGLGGNIRAQVLSFTRLAYNVLRETGGLTRYHLNTTGINMLLCRIIEEQKKNLRIFHRAAEQTGFTEQLEELVSELKRYCVLPHDLQSGQNSLAKGQQLETEPVLQDKLHDLSIIYGELEQELAGRYLYGEDYLPLLGEKLHLSTYVKNAEIWIDGFNFFAPQELQVIRKLLLSCKRVSVTLTLDKPYDFELPHELNLFYQTAQSYQLVRQVAQESWIEVEKPVVLPAEPKAVPVRFAYQSALAHLEKYFDWRPPVPCHTIEGLALTAAVNRRTEVEQVARQILSLVRDENYRFRDLAVMVRDIDLYHDLIRTIFHDYGIPVFLDQKKSMLHHPLVEFVRSAVEVVQKNWNYEAIFRCVKTDLFFALEEWHRLPQLREEMDLLENYVLAYGIGGKRWTKEEPWKYGNKQSLSEIERLRRIVTKPLLQLQQEIKNAADGRQMAVALYSLLERLDVPAKLEKWQQEAQQDGQLVRAREHAQVWRAMMELLEQLVEVLGGQRISLNLFIKLLEAGLESMRFALVPPAIDQVLVATLDRSRLSKVKCVFLLGINDGVLPARVQEKGLLSEEERSLLAGKAGIGLGPDSKRKLLDEQFLIYKALTSPSDKLWLSYPLADEEGKALMPSSLISYLKKIFPELKEQILFAGPGEGEQAGEMDLAYVARPGQALSLLVGSLRQWQKGYSISPLWWDVYNWFAANNRWREKGIELFQSLFHRNREQPLAQSNALKLYGRQLQLSVTKVEKFKACPFAHFASHGLKLKKRQVFRLEAPDIGQLFHEALTLFAGYVVEQQLEWEQLDQEECLKLAARAVDQLAPKIQGEILLSSSRYHYLTEKLKQVVGCSAAALSRQLAQSRFVPLGLELGFGPGEKLPPIKFALTNGCEIELIGRIDRVDQAVTDQGVYLRIVDYKSGTSDLDLAEVYYGLALQMLTYLDVTIVNSQRWLGQEALPAGVMYFHVQNPLLFTNKQLTEEELQRELFKRYKMKGLVLADPEVAKLMDTQLITGSDIIPVRLKKDGNFDQRAAVVRMDELAALRSHIRQVIQEVGEEMTSGVIDISPYKLKQKNSCTFCLYKSFCQFDQALAENRFRLLPASRRESVLRKLLDKGGEVLD